MSLIKVNFPNCNSVVLQNLTLIEREKSEIYIVFANEEKLITIGNNRLNEIYIKDRSIGTRHMQMNVLKDKAEITDMNSEYGTSIKFSGAKIPLIVGEQIGFQINDRVVIFKSERINCNFLCGVLRIFKRNKESYQQL